MQVASFVADDPARLDFGPFLRELRRAVNLDIDELAQRSGMSVDELGALERGVVLPTAEDLFMLARGFGMSAGTMLRLWRGPGLVTVRSDS